MADSRLRVGIYTDTALPRLNGVAVSIEAACLALVDLGVSVETVMPFNSMSVEHPFPVRWVPSVRARGRDYEIGSVWPLTNFTPAAANEYDVIHVHTLGTVGLSGLYTAWHFHIPVVLTWHTDLVAYQRHYPEIKVAATLARLFWFLGIGPPIRYKEARKQGPFAVILSSVDLVVAPSAKTVREVSRLSSGTPVIQLPSPTLPFPVPILSREVLLRDLGINHDARIILSVGRLSHEKDPALILRGFSILRRIRPEAELVLVGPDRYRDRLQRLASRLGVGSCVHMPGAVGRDALGAFFRTASVLVMTSVTETQCLVVQEAAAFGLPVVVIDGELTEGTYEGCVITEGTPRAIAGAIDRCLGQRGKELNSDYPGAEAYSPPAFDHARRLIKIYQSLAGPGIHGETD